MPYEERIERLESITWPTPLAELLDACFTTYRDAPSVGRRRTRRRSRSCARCSRAATRSPRSCAATGSSAARGWCCATSPTRGARSTARCPTTSTPTRSRTSSSGSAQLIRATDATLLDEWALLAGAARARSPGARSARRARPGRRRRGARRCAPRRSAGSSCWRRRSYGDAGRAHAAGARQRLVEAMAPYWAEYDAHRHRRRRPVGAAHFTLVEEPDRWVVTQRIVDPAGDGEWRFVASVDLDAARGRRRAHAPTRQPRAFLILFGHDRRAVAADVASWWRVPRPGGGTGRRGGLKPPWWQHHAGSIPAPGTHRAGVSFVGCRRRVRLQMAIVYGVGSVRRKDTAWSYRVDLGP